MMKFTKKKFLQLLTCAFLSPFLGSTGKVAAQPLSTLTVGTGTTSGYLAPIYSCYGYSYTQQIFTAADIIAANGGQQPATNIITKLRFHTETSSTTTTSASNNWTVYVGNTTSASFANTTSWVPLTSLTQVFTGTVTFPTPGNWMEITFASPYTWDGTSNIVVAVDENTPSWNCTVYWTSTAQTTNKTIYYYNDSNNPAPATPPTASGVTTTRSNIQFDFVVPTDNTGVDSVYTTSSSFCSGIQPVYARVHNYGSNIVNGVNVNWSVNGAAQSPVVISDPIDMENTIAGPSKTVLLGNFDFPYNTPEAVKAWTSMPNNVPDNKPSNDSSSATINANLLGINNFLLTPQDTTICVGHPITVDAGTHPKSPVYVWNNGQVTQTIQVANSGTYGVMVQNSDGCAAYDTINVAVHPNPVVNSIAIIDNEGGSYTFNVIGAQNVIDYSWDFGDNSAPQSGSGIPGQIIHQYTAAGNYIVTLTLTNDCGSITVTRQISTTGPVSTGVNNVSGLQKAVSIAPNPTTSRALITATDNVKIKSIAIYNLLGQKIFVQEKVNTSKYECNVSGFAAGIYNIVIDTDQGQVNKKLEVTK